MKPEIIPTRKLPILVDFEALSSAKVQKRILAKLRN